MHSVLQYGKFKWTTTDYNTYRKLLETLGVTARNRSNRKGYILSEDTFNRNGGAVVVYCNGVTTTDKKPATHIKAAWVHGINAMYYIDLSGDVTNRNWLGLIEDAKRNQALNADPVLAAFAAFRDSEA